jgi:hypothetical protein
MDPIAARRLEEKERRRNDILMPPSAWHGNWPEVSPWSVARTHGSPAVCSTLLQTSLTLVAGICERAHGLHARFAAL